MKIKSLHITLQSLNFIDYLSTALFLGIGGAEGNTLILWIMELVGAQPGLFIVKLAAALLIWWVYKYSKRPAFYFKLLITAYTLLLLWHGFVWFMVLTV